MRRSVMLVAAIDRNRASEDDKFVARVMSSPNCIPIAKRGEPSNFRRQFPKRKDIILRYEDKRHDGRPSDSTAPSFQIGEQDYIVSLSQSAKKMLQEPESSRILN
jgi:hypothetical protein